jgi:hypothetical protein
MPGIRIEIPKNQKTNKLENEKLSTMGDDVERQKKKNPIFLKLQKTSTPRQIMLIIITKSCKKQVFLFVIEKMKSS